MATIDRWPIIEEIIAKNGQGDAGEPSVVKIVEYVTYEGGKVWGIVFASEAYAGFGDRYEVETEYVQHPVVIWRRHNVKEAS